MASNSVNILLGLGIPWVVASIYYEVGRAEGVEERMQAARRRSWGGA
jgi:hypothetical protein